MGHLLLLLPCFYPIPFVPFPSREVEFMKEGVYPLLESPVGYNLSSR
jgi:hypothetical protein